MINCVKESFKLTNKYIILATPLILFSLLSSLYILFSVNGNLVSLVIALVLFTLMLTAFLAGWFFMIKNCVEKPDTDDDPNPEPTPEPEPEPQPEIDNYLKGLSQLRDVAEVTPAIDKRQYIRFNTSDVMGGVEFSSTANVTSISNISRGGIALKHNKSLKVGDVIPVHLKYGDIEVNADVKIVSASDVQAGGQFLNIDQATANKILYLSMVEPDAVAVNEGMNKDLQ